MSETMQPQAPRLSFLPLEVEEGMRVRQFDLSGVQAPFDGSRFTVEVGESSPVDQHGVAEIWMVAAGEGELLYDGSPTAVATGDVVYFPSMKTHQLRNTGTVPLLVYSVWWRQ